MARPILTGEDFGAIAVTDLSKLYDNQRKAVEGIIQSVHAVALRSNKVGPLAGRPPKPFDVRYLDRPHHSFVINGVRGRGKTTALVTLRAYLTALRLDPGRMPTRFKEEQQIVDDLSGLGLKPGTPGDRYIGLVVPVVFAEDMEPGENPMDAIFALMQLEIEERIAKETNDQRKRALQDLAKDLKQEVTISWAYARGHGHDTLVQDTLDYKDYVNKRADLNRTAYSRIPTWHHFLERYLDCLEYELLIVLFDDTDLDNRLALDILSTIRTFLAHPRAVSILAADLSTLVLTVQAASFARNKLALEDIAHTTLMDAYVEAELGNTVAMIDKVFPTALRHHLGSSRLSFVDGFFQDAPNDPGNNGFEAWCRKHFAASREHATAWWLLAKAYMRLVVGTPRRIVNFKAQTQEMDVDPLLALWRYTEISGFETKIEDDLSLLGQLIEARDVYAEWSGSPYQATEEDRDLRWESFVDLWLDNEIARKQLMVRQLSFVRAWLPGRINPEPFAGIDPTTRTPLGVAGCVGSGTLPRNCLYIHHFRQLSAVVFERLPPASRFATILADSLSLEEEIPDAAARVSEELRERGNETLLEYLIHKTSRALSVQEGQEDGEEIVLDACLLIYAILKRAPQRPWMQEIMNGVKTEWEVSDHARFFKEFASAVRRSERLRQEALFIWGCALEVAKSEDYAAQATLPPPPASLAIPLEATTFEDARVMALADTTLTIVRGGGRRGRLLLWSVAPWLEALYAFGSDYIRRESQVYQAWNTILAAFETADTPIEPDAWTYPDVPDDQLAEIAIAISDAHRFLETNMKANPPGGTRAIVSPLNVDAAGLGQLRLTRGVQPSELVAALLGTSVSWVESNLHVARS